jgi:hypothetical protein
MVHAGSREGLDTSAAVFGHVDRSRSHASFVTEEARVLQVVPRVLWFFPVICHFTNAISFLGVDNRSIRAHPSKRHYFTITQE